MPKTFATVSLFDISGKIAATRSGREEITFDISNMVKGTYFARFKSGSVTKTMNLLSDIKRRKSGI